MEIEHISTLFFNNQLKSNSTYFIKITVKKLGPSKSVLKVTFYYKNIFALYTQPLVPGCQLKMSFDVSHRMPSTFVTCPTA